jgi:hypothetical protein
MGKIYQERMDLRADREQQEIQQQAKVAQAQNKPN